MRLCVFEDAGVANLEPLTLTRAAFDLRLGVETILERQRRALQAAEVGAWVRPEYVDLVRHGHANIPCNDDPFARGASVWANARWAPPPALTIEAKPHVGLMGQQIAYILPPSGEFAPAPNLEPWLERCKQTLPHVAAPGNMIDYLWDLVDNHGQVLGEDWTWFHQEHGHRPMKDIALLGPEQQLVIAEDAEIEPFVVADTRKGPVLIDRSAIIHSFSRLEGPCYIGRESWILGAKLRSGTIGPGCRIGGEFEASIVQGHANKYHDGFLGHSYLGEWVNLAAGTHTSDLRNDYGPVRVIVDGQRVASGKTKIGSYIGDHSKTALAALLNTGTSIGAFCNVLPNGGMVPQVVPSFCQVQHGQLHERWDLRQLFTTAGIAMGRRGRELTEQAKDFYYWLYDHLGDRRRKALRDSEMRRMRRSV